MRRLYIACRQWRRALLDCLRREPMDERSVVDPHSLPLNPYLPASCRILPGPRRGGQILTAAGAGPITLALLGAAGTGKTLAAAGAGRRPSAARVRGYRAASGRPALDADARARALLVDEAGRMDEPALMKLAAQRTSLVILTDLPPFAKTLERLSPPPATGQPASARAATAPALCCRMGRAGGRTRRIDHRRCGRAAGGSFERHTPFDRAAAGRRAGARRAFGSGPYQRWGYRPGCRIAVGGIGLRAAGRGRARVYRRQRQWRRPPPPVQADPAPARTPAEQAVSQAPALRPPPQKATAHTTDGVRAVDAGRGNSAGVVARQLASAGCRGDGPWCPRPRSPDPRQTRRWRTPARAFRRHWRRPGPSSRSFPQLRSRRSRARSWTPRVARRSSSSRPRPHRRSSAPMVQP